MWSDTDIDQYRLINVLERKERRMHKPIKCTMMNILIGTFQIGVISLMSIQCLALDMTSMEENVLELGSYYDSEPSSPTPHTEEEDDIDARLAALDQKLMVHSLRTMTLENAGDDNKKMEEGKP